MDKFEAMHAFSTVARAGSFAAAARGLQRSRAQVNKQVIWLEDYLSVSLFSRTTRRLTLTDTGMAYLEVVERILADVREAEHLVQYSQQAPVGDLRLNAPMSFGTRHLAPAMIEFMRQYPEIRVQLILSDDKIDPVSNNFDLTLRIAAPQESPALIDHTITEAHRVLCASPEFVSRYGRPEALRQLSDLPCLHYGNLSSGNYWIFHENEQEKRVRVNGVLCSNNGDVLRDAAVAGLGVAFLPTFIVGPDIQEGRLITLLEQYRPPRLDISLLYPPHRHLSIRVRVLVEFLQQRFSQQPPWESAPRRASALD